MATKKGVWGIQDVKDKMTVSEWDYQGAKALWSWGYNQYGELAQNNRTQYSSPVQIPGSWDKMLVKYSGGTNDIGFMGTKADGTLWTWGRNTDGQLGQNQAEAQIEAASSPVQVGSGTDWGGGGATSLYGKMAAIKTDGTMYMWGSNTYSGGLGLNGPTAAGGQGSLARYSSPVQIGGTWKTGRDTITGITDGFLAINASGELMSWGRDWYGSTGQNVPDGTRRSSPVKIGSASNWAKVTDGANIRCGAINTDGELYTWGRNEFGELGHNNRTQKSAPIQVGTDTNWHRVSMTEYATMATKTDGTLWMWGRNNFGQLGQNSTQEDWGKSSPIQVPGTNWDKDHFQLNFTHTKAMKTDGTLWTWGENNYGQHGVNNRTRYSSPTQVPGTDWAGVDAVNRVAFAMKEL
tara:strand:- start:2012 stop:3229 length:1218 start_codon:yes stop_codon:yes gene_type:complete